MSQKTELTAFQIIEDAPLIRPATSRRSWMGETPEHYAYQCLPLVAANVAGWELVCPVGFTAYWDGGHEPESVRVEMTSAHKWVPIGHFGQGILTLHTGY